MKVILVPGHGGEAPKGEVQDFGAVSKDKEIDYDIVMVAAFAEPKDRVFSNVWETVDITTPVLVRTYSGMRAILYAPLTDKDIRGFHKEVMLLPIGNTNNTSVLLRKVV